jgi:mannose-6-phosphate isomerase
MTRVEKPWGYELIWAKTDKYVGKVLHINKGHQLSLQYHKLKEETIFVQSGKLQFLLEDDKGVRQTIILEAGQTAHTLPNRVHRMTALEDCDIFEVSTPELDDVVRLQDDYGR